MDKTKLNLTIILILMITTGLIIYFMYLKPEAFTTTAPNIPTPTNMRVNTTVPAPIPTICPSVPTCPDMNPKVPVAIVSRYFGVGFNIYPVGSTSPNSPTNSAYLIEHIPITTNGVAGGMYSISSDGSFTIKLKNISDPTQWWTMIEYTDPIDKSNYQVMIPNGSPTTALQYANGSLSIRPYNAPGFEGQKWLKSYTVVTRGIPVLNYSPASLFTTEFDPYSTTTSMNTDSLSDSNSKQVNDVITAVKSGIQNYLAQTNRSNPNGQMSSSSLGNKNMPLSVNLNLGAGGSGLGSGLTNPSGGSTSGVSFFDNVTGATSDSDIISILDKYEKQSTSGNDSQTVYSTNDLQKRLDTTSNGCKLVNINDYTPNRVSTCNCKL